MQCSASKTHDVEAITLLILFFLGGPSSSLTGPGVPIGCEEATCAVTAEAYLEARRLPCLDAHRAARRMKRR
ncbi:hypothetical protein GGR54DRAFT_621885 [Hypoxylon sp. NC1633]|nr:hypothetical protein GGR54DRAFT_621885 [Hypoxylon sp. NC1633]